MASSGQAGYGEPPPLHRKDTPQRLGTFTTLSKRLRVADEEFRRLEEEGQKAIKLAEKPQVPEEYRSYRNKVLLQPGALEATGVRKLIDVLLEWINDVLAERRILLRDFTEDFSDGQILTEFMEELTGQTLDDGTLSTVALSESQQRAKLRRILDFINEQLRISPEDAKWSVDAIYYKDAVATLNLLVALARGFNCPLKLPKNVRIRTLRVQRQADDRVVHEEVVEEITGDELDPLDPTLSSKDVFDRLFEHAPEKLRAVESSLLNFANKHLAKMKLEIVDIGSELHDGVFLIFLMCLLEGYCLPLSEYHLKPRTVDQKLRNTGVAFRLMEDAGLFIQRVKPDEIVHKNLKGTLRVLYAIYSKFKYCD